MSENKVPSENLAALTVDRLIQSGLLRADKRNVLITKIAEGTMNSGDWKIEIELASAKAASK